MADFSLQFDGSNDVVNYNDHPAFDAILQALTVEAWVKPTQLVLNATQTFTRKGDEYNIRMDLGKFRGYVTVPGGIKQAETPANLTLNVWQHVVMTYDGSNVSVYVDGVRKAQTAATGNVSIGSSNATVGWATSEGFPGYIDELRISNTVRYTGASFTVPTSKFINDANTILLYHFDEGSGTTVTDYSSNGINGTLGAATAAPTWSSDTPGLASSTSMSFFGDEGLVA